MSKANRFRFRAWHEGVREMLQEDICGDALRWLYKEGQSVILMQSTGLLDAEGKEIYEGDVVNVHNFLFDGTEVERNHVCVVEWCGYSAAFSFRFIAGDWVREYTAEKGHTCPVCCVNGLHEESFKVIGNIYENAELLEQSKNNTKG